MAGPLTLPGNPTQPLQAVTKQYIDSAIDSAVSIEDTAGNPLRMVCGNTAPGATNWLLYPPDLHSLALTVDTSAAGFTATPQYYAYLRGGMSYVTTGTSQIYNPAQNSFVLHVVYLGIQNDYITPYGNFIQPTHANNWQWTIYWCAVGQ